MAKEICGKLMQTKEICHRKPDHNGSCMGKALMDKRAEARRERYTARPRTGTRRSYDIHVEDKFGMLTVVELGHTVQYPSSKYPYPAALVECSCEGKTRSVIPLMNLVSGVTKSCGCLRRERSRRTATEKHLAGWNVSHGMSNHPMYSTWRLLRDEGSLTSAWQDPAVFIRDAEALIGPRPAKYYLARIDSRKPYGPGNIEWISPSERNRRIIKHGMCRPDNKHELYNTWAGIMTRCYKPNARAYRWYGALGVTLYEPWHDFPTFVAGVVAEIGPRPPGTYTGPKGLVRPVWTLDRVNPEGNYEPGNIRWATMAEQARNKRARLTT